MQSIQQLHELRKHHTAAAGGKGAALGELIAAGVPVPAGFVITTVAFNNFLQGIRPEEPSAQAIAAAALPATLKKAVTSTFASLDSPFVAVRSSATVEDGAAHAWAGQLESFVPTVADNLISNIKKCWASLYSERALAYRNQAGLTDANVSVAVVVQKMIDSSVSGIAFSAHPVTGNTGHVVIEAVHGLGEVAVGGHVTPDTYVIGKASGEVLDHYPAMQHTKLARTPGGEAAWQNVPEPAAPKLQPHQLALLVDYVRKIEKHFGFACDIEWALGGDSLYIVQSRPITTLN